MRRVVEQRRPGGPEAVVEMAVLAGVAEEQTLALREVDVDLGLGQQIARRLRQGAGRRHADVERLEQLQLTDQAGRARQLDVLSDELGRSEEERLVLDERAADRAADLRPLEGRFADAAILRLREVVDRDHVLIAEVAERRSEQPVGARLGGHQDRRGAAAELGAGARLEHLELLDAFQAVRHAGAAAVVFLVVDAVDDHRHVLAAAAADRDPGAARALGRHRAGDFARTRATWSSAPPCCG